MKVAGGYHGAIDGLLAEAGSGAHHARRPLQRRRDRRGATAATRIVPYNDVAAAAARRSRARRR